MDFVFTFLQRAGAAPMLFNAAFMDLLAETPQIPPVIFPEPLFTCAREDKHGRKMPQTIAHRGHKAKYPENSMGAFRGAVDAGVDAVETDVHISKDGVVVLSHDATLQRCFGINKKILDCEWDYLSQVRTTRAPHEPLPTLQSLIEYLAEPGNEKIWLLLDIKLDNNPNDIMRLMADVVNRVPPANGTRWEKRIVLGCWAAKFIPLCHEHFPGFPITNIGFSLPYSRQFLAVPNISFNILQASLVSPFGRRFIKEARAHNRQAYSWTVNDEKTMDWCIRSGLDGVITDDPDKFIQVRERFNESLKPTWQTHQVINFVRINFFAFIFGLLFWKKHGFNLDQKYLLAKKRK